jgi:glycosyltransferase involved in cell wall biosynthesis
MRILAFCDYLSSGSSGGSERAALETYKRMARDGANIAVVAIAGSNQPGMTERDGFRVYEIPAINLSQVARVQTVIAPALLRQVPAIVRDFAPDVLHAHNIYFQTALAAALVQLRMGLPLVTTAHIGTLSFLRQPIRALASSYERTVGRFILARSTRVIAVSQSVREHLVDLGTAPNKITVVRNGVDTSRFRPNTEPHQFSGESGPLIIFVGRLIGNKGPQVLLEALSQLRRENLQFRGVFIGDGPLRATLERRVRTAGLEGSVRFLGQLEDVAPHVRGADLIVRPSFTEGMPLTVLEAMASGICVIASDIPGNRDLISDGQNGCLVPAGLAAELARAIRRLLIDHEMRARLAHAGLETARAYSWEGTAAGTAAVLAEAKASPSRKR